MDAENPKELGHDNDNDNAGRGLEGRLERSLHKAINPVVDVGASKGLETKTEDGARDEDNKDRDHDVKGLRDARGNRRRHLNLDLVNLAKPAKERTKDDGGDHADEEALGTHLSSEQTRDRSLESRTGAINLDGGANHGNVGSHGNERGRILRSLLGAAQVKANQEGNGHRHEGHSAVVDSGKCRFKPRERGDPLRKSCRGGRDQRLEQRAHGTHDNKGHKRGKGILNCGEIYVVAYFFCDNHHHIFEFLGESHMMYLLSKVNDVLSDVGRCRVLVAQRRF